MGVLIGKWVFWGVLGCFRCEIGGFTYEMHIFRLKCAFSGVFTYKMGIFRYNFKGIFTYKWVFFSIKNHKKNPSITRGKI
jgi:hypothetical protein